MNTYSVKVVVEYEYQIEAESRDEAFETGWDYEHYDGNGVVDTITVTEIEGE
jgi:hypothetical protein